MALAPRLSGAEQMLSSIIAGKLTPGERKGVTFYVSNAQASPRSGPGGAGRFAGFGAVFVKIGLK
jgi:hypothetical protein